MSENQIRNNNMIETTDCLEAVGVFRGWKNFFLVIVVICLLLMQLAFWLVDAGYVKLSNDSDAKTETTTNDNSIEQASVIAVNDPNTTPEVSEDSKKFADIIPDISFDLLAQILGFSNGLLLIAAMLFCLTLLFSMQVSLIGRLGGINHICRAFFLGLIMLVLLMPWQRLSNSVVIGVMYTPAELVEWYNNKSISSFGTVIYYLRFVGYWVLLLLLLLLSQARSARWTKSILRRLEII